MQLDIKLTQEGQILKYTRMDQSEEQTSFQMPDPTMETLPISTTRCVVSELLEDDGNCRQSINQELSINLLSDPFFSLFSEQQKLRDVLDWANRFLCSGSEMCHELCSTNSSAADMKKKGTAKISSKHSSATKYHHPVSCDVNNSEVFEGGHSLNTIWQSRPLNYLGSFCRCKAKFSYDLRNPFSSSTGTDEEPLSDIRDTENIKSTEPQHATSEQTSSQDYHRTNRLHMSHQRHHTFTSGGSTNVMLALDTATHLIKETTSCRSNVICKKSAGFGEVRTLKPPLESNDSSPKRAGEKEVSENQKVQKKEAEQMEENEKGKIEDDRLEGKYRKEQESSSDRTYSQKSHTEPEVIPEQTVKTANSRFTCHLKLPLNVTVYEQYQLCVAQLNHLRMRQRQHVKPESPEKEVKTSEKTGDYVKAPARPGSGFKLNSHTTNPEIKKQVDNTGGKRVTVAETVEEGSSHATNKIPTEHRSAESCNNLSMKKTPAGSRRLRQRKCLITAAHFDLTGKKHPNFMKETAADRASSDETKPDDVHCAAAVSNPGLLENKIRHRHHPDGMDHQRNLSDPKKKTEDRGSQRLTDSSSRERFPRYQQAIEYTKNLNSGPNDTSKHASPYRDTHMIRQPAQTHTLHRDDPGLTSCSVVDVSVVNSSKYRSAGAPVRDLWLCLPDEVWLSILSLLPHRDLCRVVQVCHHLHTLASDHSLWKNLRIESSALTDECLLYVGRHRPRSVCLYSCSGLSVSFCGLQMFFFLCRNSLKELKVTSCTGPGLHGDQMLSAISQLCDHVTSVDVSWSGATDTGAKALRDCGKGLKSVVLNGCRVSDPPLKELVIKHKDRLEVFGCQFLTPSWLQTVYEMCPGLQHLNIGRVPKITKNSLTALAAQLKCLISLNLTGLRVTDTIVHTLLQNCVELQSLCFSSCPGVTDLTLHSISKYSPCIRSIDVSGCKAVTDAGVQSLALGCRRLQQLDLSSTRTGNRGVSLLANYCSGHFHTIKLSFCHITLEKILKLCQHCKRLKVLHLYGCAHLPTEQEIREVNSTVNVYPLS